VLQILANQPPASRVDQAESRPSGRILQPAERTASRKSTRQADSKRQERTAVALLLIVAISGGGSIGGGSD
jgi:hypothetical protein